MRISENRRIDLGLGLGVILGCVLFGLLRALGVPPLVVIGVLVGLLVLVPFGIAIYRGATGPRSIEESRRR